jgi:hypothetical protein
MPGPKKNTAFTFNVALTSQDDTKLFKTSPTLAAGDITVSKDGGDFANIDTLPTQIQTTGVLPVALTADEMNADLVVVLFHDAAGAEWCDAVVTIHTETGTLSEVDTAVDSILADTGTDGVVVASHTTAAKAEIEAEVDDALGAYDPPTKGEMDTALVNLDAAVSSRGTADTGDAMTLTAAYDAAKTAAQAGDAMTLTADYDDAKTAAQAGDAMALTAGERTTLTAAIVAGLTAATAYLAAVAAAVWAYATRTLTQSAASVTSTVSGSTITATRGDTLSASLTGLGNISAHSKLWVAVKADPDNDADTAAILLIEKTAGLTVVNGAPHATITNGSIVVTNETTGAITITVEPAVTALLAGGAYRYDVQMLTAAGVVQTLTTGNFVVDVTTDVTRAIA